MIRFCDKEGVACTIEEIEAMSRLEILSFFQKNGTLLVLVVYDTDGSFYGFITYESVLKNTEQKDYLIEKNCMFQKLFGKRQKHILKMKRN